MNFRRPWILLAKTQVSPGATQKTKPRTAYFESTSTDFPHSVEKRQKQVSSAYHAAASLLDAKLDSQPGSPGPVESELNTYISGKVLGLVAGAHAELSSAFNAINDLIASQLADEHLQFFDIGHGMCKSIFLKQVRSSLGLALHRGWAKLMLDRCRGIVKDRRALSGGEGTHREGATA